VKIQFGAFSGKRPKLSAHLLADTEAQTANQTNLEHGDLRSFRNASRISALAGTIYTSLFQYIANSTTHWVMDVAYDIDIAKSPIIEDTYERLYFTGCGQLRAFANDLVSSPFDPATDYYKLGLPAPTTAPVIEAGGGTTRYYCYIYVTAYGEEGPPSATAGGATVNDSSPTIDSIATPPSDKRITKIYLYRTASSTAGVADFRYVLSAYFFDAAATYVQNDYVVYSGTLWKCTDGSGHSGAWNAAHFTEGDDVSDANLSLSLLNSEYYEEPPTGLKGLVAHPAGFFAGFVGNTVYMSEVGLPHTWQYKEQFYENIVGLGVYGESIIVITDGYHYSLTGSHPSQMSKNRYADFCPCLAKRTIVSALDGVFFASSTGIIRIDYNGLRNATQDFLTVDDWALYYPASMNGQFYNGRYFGWYASGTNEGCIIVDFTNGILCDLDFTSDAGYVASDGNYYVILDDETSLTGTKCIKQWEGDTVNYIYYTWKSKKILLEHKVNFTAGRVFIDVDFYNTILALMSSYLTSGNVAIFVDSQPTFTGNASLFTHQTNDKLKLNVDGIIYDNINIGTADTIAVVASLINVAAGWTVASESTGGFLTITGGWGDKFASLGDGSTTAQTVIHDLFTGSTIHYDKSTWLDGSLCMTSLCTYSLCDNLLEKASGLTMDATVKFKLYVDDILRAERSISNDNVFRLPSGYRGKKVEIQLEGYIPVRKVEIGTSISALQQQ